MISFTRTFIGFPECSDVAITAYQSGLVTNTSTGTLGWGCTTPNVLVGDVKFGASTPAGQGGTFVDATDGTYGPNNEITVVGNLATVSPGATLNVGDVIQVGNSSMDIVDALSIENLTEFQAFMAQTTNTTPILPYAGVILTNDVVGMAGFSWNNHFKNLPDGFLMCGAYPDASVPDPILDQLLIQTGGVISTAPVVSNLTIRNIHFYKEQDLTLANRFIVPREYLLDHRTDIIGLDVQNCEFSSDQLSAIDGGQYITQMNGVLLRSNATDSTFKNNTFKNLTYGMTFAGSGLMFCHNLLLNMWADWIIAQGGADRMFVLWNHMQTPSGDGTYVHGDMLQIQTQSNADDVDGIYLIGNTFTPGEYQSKAYSQAEAKYNNGTNLAFSTNKIEIIQDTDRVLSSPVDQGYKITFANTTTDRFLTLPAAASNEGFTTVLRATGSGRLVFITQGTDSIEGSVTALDGATQEQIAIYSDGTNVWKILPDGLAQNNIQRYDGHTLNDLDNNMLVIVDASNGPVTINLPSNNTSDTRYLVKKIDATSNPVNIELPLGQNANDIETNNLIISPRTLTHPGSAVLFFRDAGSGPWELQDATITLQGIFANPHSNPASEIKNVWAIANVMMPLSTNGLALIAVASDGYYFHNTLARFIPEEISGDGFVGRAEGWVNGPAGTIVLRDNMASAYNFTAGNLNVGVGDSDIIEFENYAMQTGSGVLQTTAQVLAEQINLLSGSSELEFRPVTREETLAALEVTEISLAGIGAHSVTDFVNETVTLPDMEPRESFPAKNAPAIPLDSQFILRLNYPVDLVNETIILENITDGVNEPFSMTVDRTDIIITPDNQMLDQKDMRVYIGGSGVKNKFANLNDPTFGPLPISGAGDLVEVLDWTFTTDANAFESVLTKYSSTGSQADSNLSTSTGVVLGSSTRIDNNSDPSYSVGDLPFAVIFRTRVTGTTGNANVRVFLQGGATGSQFIYLDLASGIVTSSDPAAVNGVDFGVNPVAGGYEIWGLVESADTLLTRYYLELASAGSTVGLNWSETVLIPSNSPNAPFVAPLSPWI